VLILTRPSVLEVLRHVTVAPIRSTVRGVRLEVVLHVEDGKRQRCVAHLHLVQSVPMHSLGRHLAALSGANWRRRVERWRRLSAASGDALSRRSRVSSRRRSSTLL
jgi:mRNA-degrading endonuclease toxin of MazEF toxin-antitoxin module